jgi:KipI family sensor histidine kinase inhibitor
VRSVINWISYGPSALLFYFADKIGDEAFLACGAIVAELERHPPEGLVAFVPAFTSILLEFDRRTVPDPRLHVPKLIAQFRGAVATKYRAGPVKEIPVIYDGRDLERVAKHSRLPVEKVCELHAATVYKVYLLGFSPGFPYLGDLNPRLHTPRLPSPRPHVAAGSVAIGGEHTGIYPVESPGGWNIIGHTGLKLFDPARSDDAEGLFFLRQGDRVKFVAVRK